MSKTFYLTNLNMCLYTVFEGTVRSAVPVQCPCLLWSCSRWEQCRVFRPQHLKIKSLWMEKLKNLPPSLKKESWECLQINPHLKTRTAAKRSKQDKKRIHLRCDFCFSFSHRKTKIIDNYLLRDFMFCILGRCHQKQTSWEVQSNVKLLWESVIKWVLLAVSYSYWLLTTSHCHNTSSHLTSFQHSCSIHPEYAGQRQEHHSYRM